MFKRKKVNSIAKGYVRKLEVTYNAERDDYHPHFHVLIAVNRSYFKDTKTYISQKEWLNLWRDVTGNPDITRGKIAIIYRIKKCLICIINL